VLVTLLVLWVVVVPMLTLAGAYVISGILGRRVRGRSELSRGLAAEPVRIAPSTPLAPIRTRAHGGRSRDHAMTLGRRTTARGG